MNDTIEVPSRDKTSRSDGMEMTMPIAIVGMACRLPSKASDLESFWEFCLAAKNSWTEIPKDQMNTAAFSYPDSERSGAVRFSPSIPKPPQADPYATQFHIKGTHFLQESIAAFDAPFFNITANQAKSIDPRHRLLLECIYEALENGGITIGLIAGHESAFHGMCGLPVGEPDLVFLRPPRTKCDD